MAGVKHGNIAKKPHNALPDVLRTQVLDLMQNRYFDFNLSHALEMLKAHHQINLSYMTLNYWCRKANLGKRKKRRPSKLHMRRERMANEGLLLQMDGSHHRFNGDDEWCLIALIDDATSDIPWAKFYDGETTWNCMDALRMVVERKGIPWIIYTDEAGWSKRAGKRLHFSQFVRACEELGIKVVAASTPQAKGRIERSFGTIQDRIVPEFRLYGIKSVTDSNRYLEQKFLPQWRQKYCVHPASLTTRYRNLPAHIDLDNIFCMKFERQVANDHCVQFETERYQIIDRRYGSLRKKTVTIHQYRDGRIALRYGHLPLEIKKIELPERIWRKGA